MTARSTNPNNGAHRVTNKKGTPMPPRRKLETPAAIWTGQPWSGAMRRIPSRLLSNNPAMAVALHEAVPGFTAADRAVREYAEHRQVLAATDAPSVDDLVAGLADRYLAGDDIDIEAEREPFTLADSTAREDADFSESHLRVGELLLDHREALVNQHADEIAAHLTGQLNDLLAELRKAGVTSTTAKVAEFGRDDTDVRALRAGLPRFDTLRNATTDLLSGVNYASARPETIALVKLLSDPLAVDPFWAVTFKAGRWAEKAETGEVRSEVSVPDFLNADSPTVLAWLCEHPEAEARIPSPAQAQAGSARLSQELSRVAESQGKSMRRTVKRVMGMNGPAHTTVWEVEPRNGWADGDGDVWAIKISEAGVSRITYVHGRPV